MRNYLIICLLAVITASSFHANAMNNQNDTIYFYSSWEQMLSNSPEAYIVNPFFQMVSPYELYIETGNDEVNDMIVDKYIALSQGDSIWLMNSEYLKRDFRNDSKHLNGFVPVFFNEKTAFLTGTGPLTVKDILLGNDPDGVTSYTIALYYIDFINNRVKRVTHEYLSELLTDYHDLKMRYEGMKDYKKDYIIGEYFYKFIDRASEDFMRPNIVDLCE